VDLTQAFPPGSLTPGNLELQNDIIIAIKVLWIVLGAVGAIASSYVIRDIFRDEEARRLGHVNGIVGAVIWRDKRSELIRLSELVLATIVGLLSMGQPLPPIRLNAVGWITLLMICALLSGIVANTVLTARFRIAVRAAISGKEWSRGDLGRREQTDQHVDALEDREP
jgi:uncharacterized membrane protein YeaQ/YmgE (transglycosylase-associated protein family)